MWLLVFFLFSALASHQTHCTPIIENIRFDGEYIPAVSRRMAQLHSSDQAIRQNSSEDDVEAMLRADRSRREQVLDFLQAGQLVIASDLYSAALIFQHGDCSDHYQLAANLAWRAYELGHPNAGWLYGAATDRYLLSVGQLQIYGTQFMPGPDGHFHVCPIEPDAVTDEERIALGLLSLEEVEAWAVELDELYPEALKVTWQRFFSPLLIRIRCSRF